MKKILLWIVFFAVGTAFGQVKDDAIKVDLSTPQSTLRTHFHFLDKEYYHPEKSAQTIQGYKGKKAEELAIKIRKILKGRGLFVVVRKVPNNPNFMDTIRNEALHRYTLFPERMPQIYLEKVGDKWYYSEHTLLQIDKLYDEVFPWYAQKIQKILPKFQNESFWGIEIWKYLGVFLLLIFSILLFFISNKIIFLILAKVQKIISKIVDNKATIILKKIARPLSFLLVITLIRGILPVLSIGLKFNTAVFFCVDLLFICFMIYLLLKIMNFVMLLYVNYTKTTNNKMDEQMIPILKHFLNIMVVFWGILQILSFLGVDSLKIMAGLSLGGLAVAFASQDTVKNFIGTIMIFVDKPFQIGDYIIAGDVEGTVEKVSFRSTILRAPDTSIFQITNSRLSEITVKNRGLLKYRRYMTELGLRYDTPPELVEAFVKGLRQIIEKHTGTLSDNYNVEFTGFGDSALLILMNVYFEDTNWAQEQKAKHTLHMAILKFANEIGVGFAFPSTTVMVEQFPNTGNDFPKYTATQKDVDTVLNGITFE
ncbi:MAG: mechanosensitive ion channel family protein [Flavobacteriaceae bacterium]|nr:mechanosensitive ion channel family protein [Flavobacteriaceae bacterium]